MDLINEIRRKNGYDPEMLKRVAQDREIEDSMQSMTESLGQAMKKYAFDHLGKPGYKIHSSPACLMKFIPSPRTFCSNLFKMRTTMTIRITPL